MLPMVDKERNETEAPTFLSAAVEVARLMDLDNAASVPEDQRARHLAHAVRKPLLERVSLPEEFFSSLMTAAVYDPDPSFCRWFIEPHGLRIRAPSGHDSTAQLCTDRHRR